MDALKKAELAKRRGENGESISSTTWPTLEDFALEPMPAAAESPSSAPLADSTSPKEIAPDLPSHLEELDAQFLAEARQAASIRVKSPPASLSPTSGPGVRGGSSGKPRSAPSEQKAPPEPSAQNISAAQNLFAAKQTAKPAPRRNFAIVMGAFTVLTAGGIGGYVWWQLQPKTAIASAPLLQVPTPAPAPIAAPPASTLAAAPAVAPAGSPTTARLATAVADDQDGDSVQAAVNAATRPPAPLRRTIPAKVAPIANAEQTKPIRVTKAPLKINPALTRGFDAFNRGDLAASQLEYELAQKADPHNPDALHGLAAVAVRQGRLDLAEQLYRQLAESDPHDTVAMSALINLRGQMDPNTAESRLKSLSADQPELAAPQFSLGNLYARHGRWNEAQQAYFKAYSVEPDNPDIMFNLAISLEHMRQNKLAAKYYSQAIAAAQTRPAGFDKAQASARLNSLQP